MSLKKIILGLLALCPLAVSAQHGFLGKHVLVDVNLNTSSQSLRPFDAKWDALWFDNLNDELDETPSTYVKDDGTSEDMEKKRWWNFNIFFSANIETIVWKKGSVMLEARMCPYSDYYFEDQIVKRTNSNFWDDFSFRLGQQRSYEAGIGYRQYLGSSSNAPYGRYIQLGVNRLQVQWKHNCLDLDKVTGLSEELTSYYKNQQKAGYEDMWAGYFEFGYNHLFFNNRLRLSLSMRTEFPVGYDAKEKDLENENIKNNAAFYAIRHYWSTNLFSLKVGAGFLIF